MVNKVGLTASRIAGLKPPSTGQVEVPDNIVPGLRLRIGASGIKTYILRKRVNGKWVNVAIGRHAPSFTLANARQKARDLLVDIDQGKGLERAPKANKSASNGVGTVADFYEMYLSQQVDGKKRSAREFRRVFRHYIEPELGGRLVDSVTRSDVSRFIEKLAFDRGRETPIMARNVHRHLSAFYAWALTRLDHMPANPCRDAWKPQRSQPRDRVLSDRELSALWQAASEDGHPFGHLVQMLILTAQRRGEVLEAACDEFDLEGKTWTIPGVRAKNGKANVVPLSAQAFAVVIDMFTRSGILPEDAHMKSELLLASKVTATNSVSGLSKAWKRIRRSADLKLGYESPHYTMHDIRRTVATGLQRLGVPLVVSEAVLNHQSGSAMSGVAGVYHRHQYTQEKREALALWGKEVMQLTSKYHSNSFVTF